MVESVNPFQRYEGNPKSTVIYASFRFRRIRSQPSKFLHLTTDAQDQREFTNLGAIGPSAVIREQFTHL
jgi:hypothetical protein